MKNHHTRYFAAVIAVGLAVVCPTTYAEPETTVADETQADAEAATGVVQGKIQLPDEGEDAKEHAITDVTVRILSVIRRSPYPTPENWESLTRDEQVAWKNEFVKTEAYRELIRKNKEAQAAQISRFTTVSEDGSYSFEGLRPDRYLLQALIRRPGVGDVFSKSFAHAYTSKVFKIESAGQSVDLGSLTLEIQDYLSVGSIAPEWTATAYDGSKVRLSDYRGKYVLLDFWATWCGPCIAETPNLEAVYADYGGEKFEIIGLSLDATIELPKRYHEKKPSPYTNLYIGKWNADETTTDAYGIKGIPSIWLIGPDGKIVARDLRGKALREAVRVAVEGEAERATVAEPKTD